MENNWILTFYSVGKNGKNVSQTWTNPDGRQWSISGISLDEYCKGHPKDVSASEILEKSKRMGL